MNREAVSAIAEIVGVIAVIASLIYVGLQIKQNSAIARANIVHETNTAALRIQGLIAQDAALAAIYKKDTSNIPL